MPKRVIAKSATHAAECDALLLTSKPYTGSIYTGEQVKMNLYSFCLGKKISLVEIFEVDRYPYEIPMVCMHAH